MTLQDLYDAIDWSKVDETKEEWERQKGMYTPTGEMDNWPVLWRCAVLECALYDEDTKKRVCALTVLNNLGVLGQVCNFMKKHGLTEKDAC